MKLLVVDDDSKFRETLQRGLEENGIETLTACDAREASTLIEGCSSRPFDIILLDVMMPGQSGWEFLEQLREAKNYTPVIFLTARESVNERVMGLRLGADDYVIKPFEFPELLARIDAVLRRRKLPVVEAGHFLIDIVNRIVHCGEDSIELTNKEFELLVTLHGADGRVLSREDLLQSVWRIDFDPGTNLVDVTIARLRKKLERYGPRTIETVVGVGYRYDCRPIDPQR